MPVETVVKVTKTVRDAANKVVRTSIEEMETFLQTFATVVHANHVVLLPKKGTLATMYGGMGTWEGLGLALEEMSKGRYRCHYFRWIQNCTDSNFPHFFCQLSLKMFGRQQWPLLLFCTLRKMIGWSACALQLLYSVRFVTYSTYTGVVKMD
jgi:hypothetical protein